MFICEEYLDTLFFHSGVKEPANILVDIRPRWVTILKKYVGGHRHPTLHVLTLNEPVSGRTVKYRGLLSFLPHIYQD
jgi:hypothetical protein